jgi:hypothetical protein
MPTASSSAECATTTTACNLIQALLHPWLPALPLSCIGDNQLTGHHQLVTIFTNATDASTNPLPALTPQVSPGFALLPAPATNIIPKDANRISYSTSSKGIPREYIQATRSRISSLVICSRGLFNIFGFLLSFMYLLTIFFASGELL